MVYFSSYYCRLYKATREEARVMSVLSHHADLLPSFVHKAILPHPKVRSLLQSFGKIYFLVLREGTAELRETFPDLTDQQVEAVRLYDDHILLGWCTVDLLLDERIAAIEMMEVPEPLRRRGVGTLLLQYLEQEVADDRVILPVTPLLEAAGFWRRYAEKEFRSLVDEMGEEEAQQLCKSTLDWSYIFCRAMMEKDYVLPSLEDDLEDFAAKATVDDAASDDAASDQTAC